MLSRFLEAGDKVKQVLSSGRVIKSSLITRSSSTMVGQTEAPPPKVQALYDLCKKTFSPSLPSPPSPLETQALCALLDSLTPSDLGLKEGELDGDRGHDFFGFQQFRTAGWPKPLSYIDICDNDSFTICIFCFPESSTIPLHDHPGMTVFSKVLYGSLHLKAYDWVDPPRTKPRDLRLAKLTADTVLTSSCGTSAVNPKSGGNIHCFTSITPCAVIDVLTPPYKEDLGRRCAYYHDYPFSSSSNGDGDGDGDGDSVDYAWLREVGLPPNFYMTSAKYKGPLLII